MSEPAGMDSQQHMRLRAAAFRAQKLWPGPIGNLIYREIINWESFGYQLGGHGEVMQLVAAIEKVAA